MPIYEVSHSYPLKPVQKEALAQAITRLHSTAFLTPSLFVHVHFKASDASEPNYYLAGKACSLSTNRIQAMVRTGPSRSHEDFNNLASKIEEAWHEVVSGEMITEGKNEGQRKGEVDEGDKERRAKKLLVVAFYAMVGAREQGHSVPKAGEEAAWFKELKPEFEKRAERGDEEYKDMLEEVEAREDLKKAYLG